MDNESLRQCPQVQLLSGQLVLLAGGAVPTDRAQIRTQTLSGHALYQVAFIGPVQSKDAALTSSLLVTLIHSSHVTHQGLTNCFLFMGSCTHVYFHLVSSP